jgi:hypothetical protein
MIFQGLQHCIPAIHKLLHFLVDCILNIEFDVFDAVVIEERVECVAIDHFVNHDGL